LKDPLVRVLWYFKQPYHERFTGTLVTFGGIDGFANNFSSSSSKIISTIIRFLFGKTGCQKIS